MRYLAVSRFRLLSVIRAATPIFVVAILPLVPAAIAVSVSEPSLRSDPEFWLRVQAQLAVAGWVGHAIAISFAALMSGKVKTAHDEMWVNDAADLMETAPISAAERFWGEALGTLTATAIIHLCCLPLLAAAAVLSPLPIAMFAAIEAATLALLVIASTGAAWQRRAPRTKYSATRGPRNVAVVAALALVVIVFTSRPVALRDSAVAFLFSQASLRGWSEVARAVEKPTLLVVLLSALYAGTILYYYRSATRKTAWEN